VASESEQYFMKKTIQSIRHGWQKISCGLFLILALAMATICSGQAVGPYPFYGNYYLHDPGTMIKEGTNYFIYGDGQGIDGIKSTDLRNWSVTPAIFPGGPPAWTSNSVPGFTGYFWAPDNAYFNGRYNIYYACSQWGTINSAIGLVTTPSLVSPVWTDQGKVIQSNPNFATNATTDLTAYNCIDPSIMVDTNGSVWMSFGSYSDGILIMQLDPATGKRISPGSPIYRVANNGPSFFSNTEEGSCLYQHGGYYYLFVNFGGCCAGVDSTYNIRVGRSPTPSGPYYDKSGTNMVNGGGTMVLESTARYIGPGHAAIMNDNGTNWFTFHYYDGNNNGNATVGMMKLNWTADGWPALTNDWSAFYPFNRNAHEHLGLYNGTLMNGSFITNDPGLGGVLNLDGVTNYAVLADPVANCSTITAWVKWNGGAIWQRVFDFGSNTTNYFFLTPKSIAGTMRFAITTTSNGGEQQINAASAMPIGSWCHIAVTLDGTKGVLYLNGAPVATNSNLTIRPWQTLAKNNYIGKSQWPNDPLFNGEISSFRIFGRALSGTEIQDLAYAHPALAHRYSFAANIWDSIGMAHGSLAGNAVVTNHALQLTGTAGDYVNLPGGLVSGSSALTLEFWATFGANGNWVRVFDFGNTTGTSGYNFVFYSPHTSASGQQLSLSTPVSTVNFVTPGILDNSAVHVVCILDPANNDCAVYTNGVLQSSLTTALPPLTGVSSAWSFIGRSLFSSDAWLNATIDELRIYDGRLTPQEIALNDQYGPNALAMSVSLTQSNSVSGLTLSWPSWAVGFALQTATDLTSGVWTTPAQTPSLAGNQWSLTVPTTNAATYYRLER
jgi:arabinan endo-1,5-alpha-L-arabinosidase